MLYKRCAKGSKALPQTPNSGFQNSSFYHCHFWLCYRSPKHWQLTESFALVFRWQSAGSRQLRLYHACLLQLLTIIMPALITLDRWNCGGTIIRSRCIWCLHYEMVLWVYVYQKQWCLIKRLEPRVRANWFLAISSWTCETMFYTVLRKTVFWNWQMKKMGCERSQAVKRALFQWTGAWRTGWFSFHRVTQSNRVRRKGRDNEIWSEALPLADGRVQFGTHTIVTCT